MASIALRLSRNSPALRHLVAATRSRAIRIPSRQLHDRKELPYPIEQGVGDFLSPDALRTLAVDYQEGLLDRLNALVRKDDGMRSMSVVQTVIDAARDPSKVLEFNYACEALNNSFFLESLTPPKPGQTSNEDDLLHHRSGLAGIIRTNFNSVDQFKSTFSAAVLGMFGSGWMWFVCDTRGRIAIYPTYGVGTLLVGSSEHRAQTSYQKVIGEGTERPLPSPTVPPSASPFSSTSPTSGVSHSAPPLHPSSPSRTFSHSTTSASDFVHKTNMYEQTTKKDDLRSLGDALYPLFCVSVHERAWVGAGYGVWGKEEYMKRFWSVLNWKAVCDNYVKWVPENRFKP